MDTNMRVPSLNELINSILRQIVTSILEHHTFMKTWKNQKSSQTQNFRESMHCVTYLFYKEEISLQGKLTLNNSQGIDHNFAHLFTTTTVNSLKNTATA